MRMIRRLPAFVLALSVSAASAMGQSHHTAAKPDMRVPLYDNLGDHHYTITTNVPEAQQYFDQGMRLTYGFNHAEAIRAFNEAARLDPDCAICHWGAALAYGPHVN